jgi:MoCo/4Fe-4S cofactor protein with predicted Tat translocation signal
MGKNTKYWKGLGELKNDPELMKQQENEFAEKLPSDIFSNEGLNEASTSRRDFLKYLGFSVGAAALASCEAPVTKTIPYVFKPEEVTPGMANWYASTFDDGFDYCSILVKTREGRPIKIEGNPNSKITMGGTNARVQGSVLSLYDKSRFRGPLNVKSKDKNANTWKVVDEDVKKAIAGAVAAGKSVRILTGTIHSPSMLEAIKAFSKTVGAKHIQYDAVSNYAIRKANWHTHNVDAIPSYNFGNANVIVSFGADFLVNWLSPIEFSRQYVKNRKVSKDRKTMSKHVQFESTLSVTGSNADFRVPVKPSEIGANIVGLYNALSGGSLAGGKTSAQVTKVAEWLKQNKNNGGKALVVCGMNDVAMQVMVNKINEWLGSYGFTIDNTNTCNLSQGNDEEFVKLLGEMKSGDVGALIMYRTNPVYTGAAWDFAGALSKVGVKISLSTAPDETSAMCDFVCPDHHYLESWSDHNPKKGHYSLGQPSIAPIFRTRSAMETFLTWAGNKTSAHTYIVNYWIERVWPMQGKYMVFADFWNHSLHDGAVEVGTGGPVMMDDKKKEEEKKGEKKEGEQKEEEKKEETVMTENRMDVNTAAASIAKIKGSGMELVVYVKTGPGAGQHSNNPWLMEFPDPISKVTWDNYVTMNPADMAGKYSLLERQDMNGDMAEVTVGNMKVTLPVFPQPGQALGTLGIAVGYGRTSNGKVSEIAKGINAYQFLQKTTDNTLQYFADKNVSIGDATGEKFAFACTQQHHTMMGRKIVNETTLETYINSKDEKDVQHWNHREMITVMDSNAHHQKVTVDKVDLWDEHAKLSYKWGMAIDLNSCIGCGACVISCQAENNTAVVGRDQIMKTRDMYWMRIDRYYSDNWPSHIADAKKKAGEEHVGQIEMYLDMEKPQTENPKVTFQPVMCQHCSHAPCETVCPVLATNHSSEGLNQMTYNRCVGTRYCANNCPYKVRRFNWFNYNANYRFAHINPSQESDELGRMVLNPDVVVRSRGVMEKCSMCVQRIQGGKLKAKVENRKLMDGEIQTACAQACPTNAIIFGDLNNPESEIAKYAKDDRMYHLLEDVGAQPSVFYMTKVRNSEEVAEEKHLDKKEHEKKKDHA